MGAVCPRCGAVFCYCDQEDADLERVAYRSAAIGVWIAFLAILAVLAAISCRSKPIPPIQPVQPAPLPGETWTGLTPPGDTPGHAAGHSAPPRDPSR